MLLDMQIYMPTQDPLARKDAAFTPRQIKKWIKTLPVVDLDSISKQAHQLIYKSNRLTYSPKQRLISIDLLQPLAKKLLDHQRRFLACQAFPLSPGASEIYALQQSLNAEIAIAYKIIIAAAMQGDVRLDQKKLLHCLYKAMSYLQRQYTACLLMYQQLPSTIWHDICQLYRVAEHYKIHNKSVYDENKDCKHSIINIFKHLCSLTLISFNQLRQGEADKVNRFLEQHYELIQITRDIDSLAGEYIYIANLATGKQPTYYIAREMPISAENRFIGYAALAEKLTESTQKFAQSVSYYLQSSDELDPELAGRLITMIGNPNQRGKKRLRANQSVHAVIGLTKIIQTMTAKNQPASEGSGATDEKESFSIDSLSLLPIEESATGNSPAPLYSAADETLSDIWNPFTLEDAANTKKTDGSDTAASMDEWHVENFSPGGFCLHYKSTGICTTRVGEIIAIRGKHKDLDELEWRAGIIRWMQGLRNQEHKIGVELFGAECGCISAYDKDNSHNEYQGLLLKRTLKDTKGYSVLLPARIDLDSEEIIIRGNTNERTVKLGRALEKTSCFTHIEVTKIFSNKQ